MKSERFHRINPIKSLCDFVGQIVQEIYPEAYAENIEEIFSVLRQGINDRYKNEHLTYRAIFYQCCDISQSF